MKILLFDIDETLLSCGKEVNIKSSQKMFKKCFGIDAHEEMINNTGKTEKGIIEEVLRLVKQIPASRPIEIHNEAYVEWAKAVADILVHTRVIISPGVTFLLEKLAENPDVILGLLTGNSRFRSEAKLEAAGLKHFFMNDKGVLNGAFGDISNKRADLIEEAKDKYGKENTYIIIDDSLIGAKMAHENNIPAILVATGKASENELKKYSRNVFADFGGNRWKEVAKLCDELNSLLL